MKDTEREDSSLASFMSCVEECISERYRGRERKALCGAEGESVVHVLWEC